MGPPAGGFRLILDTFLKNDAGKLQNAETRTGENREMQRGLENMT